jgi:alpha-amylase
LHLFRFFCCFSIEQKQIPQHEIVSSAVKSINVVFAVHNHQPIGNFDSVFEEVYQHSYKPFLEVLGRHRGVKCTQHWTGPLLEWIAAKHPELIEKMRHMVKRGQLELLTGSYYEAILAIIPEDDRIGQIRKLTEYIHRLFDYEPRGIWLAERVWEQQLVSSIARAGVEFVVVDDTHFRHAGLQDDELLGYYVTEEQGATLKVIPIDKTLRYTIPFRELAETTHYLQQVSSEHSDRVVLHADDGEKFGAWPRTYESVYEKGWLDSYCRLMVENAGWIHTRHLSEIVDTVVPRGRVYLPTASYSEMLKWALPSTSFVQLERFEKQLKSAGTYGENAMFVRGGYWRNFLARYPEANHMHKKMLRLAHRARSAKLQGADGRYVHDHIWAGQCNDPYWHGVFGGLYLPNLRFPVYRNLLQAEVRMDRQGKTSNLRVEQTDFDCDGADEVLIESNELNLYLKPSTGGSLVELDFKPAAFNLLDILTRREEGYHRRLMALGDFADHDNVHDGVLMKEKGLEKHLHFDWYRRASLLDHFIGPETTLENFSQCRYPEIGDFILEPYSARIKKSKDAVSVLLRREGALWFGERRHRLVVEKEISYTPGSGDFRVRYRVLNGEATPVDIRFGIECNVGLLAGNAHDRYYVIEGKKPEDNRLRSTGVSVHVSRWKLVDEWLGIETGFHVSVPAMLWRFPIETVSLSEQGLEKVYQSSVVMPLWEMKLDREFAVTLVQNIKKTGSHSPVRK